MKKWILFIVGFVVVLGITVLILANQESPDRTKNLLSYFIFHEKKWACNPVSEKQNDQYANLRWSLLMKKKYYFGIPILDSSCPEGYTQGELK